MVLDSGPIVMEAENSVHSFGLFPKASRFLLQRISCSGYEIGFSRNIFVIHAIQLIGA